MEIVLFILIVYGITNIIVNEQILKSIVDRIRAINTFFDKVFRCPTCLSFYIGMLIYLLIQFSISGIFYVDIFLAGTLASGAVNLLEYLKIKSM